MCVQFNFQFFQKGVEDRIKVDITLLRPLMIVYPSQADSSSRCIALDFSSSYNVEGVLKATLGASKIYKMRVNCVIYTNVIQNL